MTVAALALPAALGRQVVDSFRRTSAGFRSENRDPLPSVDAPSNEKAP